MSRVIRPKFTETEARTLLTIGRAILDDEALAEQLLNSLDTSACFRALGKVTDALIKEPKKK